MRALRQRAALDQVDLANRLGVTQAQVSRAETAARVPSERLVARWIEVCDPDGETDRELLARLREAAASARTSWAGVHSWGLDVTQRGYAELERAAVGLRVFQSSVIPGQLQIGPYARRVFELATDFGAEEIARAVQARLERQLIVHRPPRDGCRFVVTEAALRWRPIGDPDARTQIAQLDRLLTLLDLPGVDLRVLPWDEPQVATHRQSFVHLTLSEDDDEPAGPGLVIVEGIDGENRIHDPDRVELYRKWFERYAEHAHGGEDARTLIRRIIDSLRVVRG